jgi:D-alanyl-D-alanine carboxypeptidase (penicillin-binding protein 5/6)
VLVTAAVKLTHGGTAEAEPDTVDGDIAVEYMDNQVADITTISKDDLKFFQDSDSENEEEVTAAAAMPYVAPAAVDGKIQVGEVEFMAGTEAHTTTLTKDDVVSEVNSSHAILINESDNTIVAQRDAMTKIYPASMTKVLTVLVAAEHITNLDDEFTITIDITDYAYSNDCSAVGFLDGETVTVRDLFYGTILPSGGDAALGLATYVAGSQEAFVELMNEKLEELGIADTAHFTNCIGLYDDNHYCTAYDMAVIMKAAVENELCREVLSAHTYTTSSTEQHPDGITISNWFLRRIEDKDSGGLVLCGKTGFVNQSGSCAVSYYISDSGVPYICVTADTYSSWRCLYDHVAIYNEYAD